MKKRVKPKQRIKGGWMGTRNLTIVYLDGEYKVAQYCQWDGYPEGSGVEVLDFLIKADIERFKQGVRNFVKEFTDEQVLSFLIEEGCDLFQEEIPNEVYRKIFKLYPQFSRDVGPEILSKITHHYKRNQDIYVQIDTDFAKDSLFCEWAYVIDLDQMVLEVYAGFNREELTEADRFYWLQAKNRYIGDYRFAPPSKEYFPVKLLCSFSIERLPSQAEFLEKCIKAHTKYSEFQEEISKKSR